MKKKSLEQKRQSVESIAQQAHANLTEAKRLIGQSEHVMAFILAQATWPLVVFCLHRRLTIASAKTKRWTTSSLICGMVTGKLVDPEMAGRLRQADIIASMGVDGAHDVVTLTSEGIKALESSESSGCRRRRHQPAQEPSRPFVLRRWATAAVSLLTLGASS